MTDASSALRQSSSKGESIGSRSVLDSTPIPVVKFRHLASARHHGFDGIPYRFNNLAIGRALADLFAKC
jgi:hypothetical protein